MIRSCDSRFTSPPSIQADRVSHGAAGADSPASAERLEARAAPKIQKCLFVVSYPRSGTHLLIDFIRRNFPAFNPALSPWDSAAKLYLRLDGPDWRNEISVFKRSHVLAQSHRAGYADNTDLGACEILKPRAAIYLYPFREFSRVVKSFAEFRGAAPPISAILKQQDTFFGKASTVAESIHDHAAAWMDREVHFIDCDALLANPEVGCLRLAILLGERPAQIRRRLPGRKLLRGKPGELVERVRGRCSTEVIVSRKLSWRNDEERLYVDSQFQALHLELIGRSLHPSHGYDQSLRSA